MYQLLKPETVEKGHLPVSASTTDREIWRWLEDKDRALLQMASRGVTVREIARLTGMIPGTVSRRIAVLQARLTTPMTRFLLHPNCPLDPEILDVARLHLITGLSVRRIAAALQMPLFTVRRHVIHARAIQRAFPIRK